ncbi:MAG: protein-glutamate O-methyltransferase CheR [Deltaproteobacteria bacterium]|nr:protein-glutamate O-methyltransferase CheR [Deltaproteobacteria bacterium]
MAFGTEAVTITEEEFLLIRGLIYNYCGILLPQSMAYLVERRLRPRLDAHGLTSFRDYYRLIKYGRDLHNEFDEIVERITTNESYFFRESYQLDAFTDEIMPIITSNRDSRERIRIWSAGCATGEEPYTIAMLVREAKSTQGYKFDIFGNDVSKKVLRLARAGFYRENSFRQTDKRYRDKYFHKAKDGWQINDEIRSSVTFGHVNLMDEASMALIANVDVVFCRNVLIYFSAESRVQLIDAFYRKLRPGGFLLLGHSESLINSSTKFELVALKNDIVYRRPPDTKIIGPKKVS